MNNFPRIVRLACLTLLVVGAYTCEVIAQMIAANSPTKGRASPAPSMVACSPDKPIARPGEVIHLRAYARSKEGKSLHYSWQATVGRIRGEGSEVSWDLTDVAVGLHEARVSVNNGSGGLAECSVRVAVQIQRQLPMRGSRETGRTLLVANEVETNGYGLYSYLLLGSQPTDASRERYLKAIEEFLKFPDIARLEDFKIPRRSLNISYLPILSFPSHEVLAWLSEQRYNEASEWMLKRYDYERARVVLRGLPESQREGPYIVSFLKPPTWTRPPSPPYLYQDQSSVPPHLVSLWAKEFLNQAAQEQFWQERTTVQLVLKLRTAIGILAGALPESKLENWIAWIS